MEVAQVGLVEVGTMLGQGLQFVSLDESLNKVIERHAGKKCQLSPAKPAIEEDIDNGVEARAATEAVEIIIGEDTRQQLLGAVATLPQLRSVFTEQIADQIADARAESEEYDKLVSSLKRAQGSMEKAMAAIHEFDEQAVPGFDIDALVKWDPIKEPEPKTFSFGSNGRSGTRQRSQVKWTLDQYIPRQTTVEGDEASFHNVRLVRTRGGWTVMSDEGMLEEESTPNKAMRSMLIAAGLSPQRSANDFWQGSEQEKAAGV